MRVAGRGTSVSGREASQCPSRKVLLSVVYARSGLEAKEDWPAMSADPHYLARTTGGTYIQMQINLLPLGGHAHLAEPGTRSLCKQTPGERARNSQED